MINSNHADLNNNLGNVLLQQKKYAESIGILNRLSRFSPKIVIFITVWVALMLMDRIKESENFKNFLGAGAKNSDTHANIGALFWEKVV